MLSKKYNKDKPPYLEAIRDTFPQKLIKDKNIAHIYIYVSFFFNAFEDCHSRYYHIENSMKIGESIPYMISNNYAFFQYFYLTWFLFLKLDWNLQNCEASYVDEIVM